MSQRSAFERRGERHRRGIRAAAAERGDPARAGRSPETRRRRRPAPGPGGAEARRLRSLRSAPCRARRRCGSGSANRATSAHRSPAPAARAPAVPAVTCSPDGDDDVIFAGIVQTARLARPVDELVRHPRHRRDDDRYFVAGIDFASNAAGQHFLIRSISATDVPPNFCTMRAMCPQGSSEPLPVLRAHHILLSGRSGHPAVPCGTRRIATVRETSATVDPEEIDRFAAQAGAWWDPDGSLPGAASAQSDPARLYPLSAAGTFRARSQPVATLCRAHPARYRLRRRPRRRADGAPRLPRNRRRRRVRKRLPPPARTRNEPAWRSTIGSPPPNR